MFDLKKLIKYFGLHVFVAIILMLLDCKDLALSLIINSLLKVLGDWMLKSKSDGLNYKNYYDSIKEISFI